MHASTASEPDHSIAPEGRRRLPGRRRVGRVAAAGLVALVLASAAWFVSRFDVLGHAGAAYERHEYRTALRAAQDHLRFFPNDRRAALMAAQCLARLGRVREAEPYYRRAEPLELAEMQVRAYALVQANDPVGSARVYEELLSRCPDDALALKRLAAVRMGRKQWKSALELADRLKSLPSEAVAGWTLTAIASHELKRYEQAVAAGRRVLTLDPRLEFMPLPRTLFWNNFALDLMALGQTVEARGYLEQAVAGSEDASLMELLGTTYSQQGLTDQAEQCWRQAERWDPNNADVCLDLGRLAMSRRHWGEAVDFLKRAADRSSEAVEPLYNLSLAYRMLGNPDEAARYRRLADRRRAAMPPRRGSMGEEVDRPEAPDGGPAGSRPEPRQ